MQSLQKPLTLSEIKLRSGQWASSAYSIMAYRSSLSGLLQGSPWLLLLSLRNNFRSATLHVRISNLQRQRQCIHESRNMACTLGLLAPRQSLILQRSAHEDAASFISSPYPPGQYRTRWFWSMPRGAHVSMAHGWKRYTCTKVPCI